MNKYQENNFKTPVQQHSSTLMEIARFESVHPAIYSIYELLETISEIPVSNLIREHVVSIEDSFVNSQEWTLSRDVKEIRIGVVGHHSSEKSSLVHRYITGTFLHDSDSQDGGRFKKEYTIGSKSYLLLIRDEADVDQLENLYAWIHCLVVVSNSTLANSIISNIRTNVPVLLVAICTHGNDFVESFQQIQHDAFAQVQHWSRTEIDLVFSTATKLALTQIDSMNLVNQNDTKKVSSYNTPLSTPVSNRKLRRRSNLFNNSCKSLGVGRTIPIKQGLLYKKTDKSKRWKKKYVVLLNDELIYYNSINDYMENSNGKIIKLLNTCVKPSTGLTKSNFDTKASPMPGFTLTTLEKKIYEFEVESNDELDCWLKLVQEVIMSLIQHSGSGTSNIDLLLLERIKRLPGNDACCDCGEKNPLWACINHGTLVCIKCSGVHRQLGTHISRIRSLQLDEFSHDQLEMLLLVGNQVFNNVYGGICQDPDAIQNFIRDKYVFKKFVKSTNLSVKELKEALTLHNVEAVIRYVANQLPFSKEIDSSCYAIIQQFAFQSSVSNQQRLTPNQPSKSSNHV